ncbi:hypothetical protein [Streptococcus merionis]|uniref:Uncharacterized protein n=1 Tax=Streptococcus merionis TaxID=400065 RepID=A0A239SPR5_9STRE|nr:hypothetical protein [Streptococcus merionis]SNU87249.1 Uncharacterised protein [Streptococcus merionis]
MKRRFLTFVWVMVLSIFTGTSLVHASSDAGLVTGINSALDEVSTEEQSLNNAFDVNSQIRPVMDEDGPRNIRKTNYKLNSGWYYGHTVVLGPQSGIISIYKTYDIYYRNVEYDLEYDVHNKYTGRFLRHVKTHIRTTEEQWRLKK